MALEAHKDIWKCNTCTLINCWDDEECLACKRRRPYQTKKLKSNIITVKKKRTTAAPSPSASSHDRNDRTPQQPRKKLRQAKEKNGVVALLCYACRHDDGNTKQASLSSFFKPSHSSATAGCEAVPPNHCSRCRKPLTKPSRRTTNATDQSFTVNGALPQIERLKRYRKAAKENKVPFEITDREATDMMAMDCSLCGVSALPEVGHGITRLRIWPERLRDRQSGCSKPFMGPFVTEVSSSSVPFRRI